MTGHAEQYRVTFADTDAGGIVYHARYFEMAERGRNEAARAAGLDLNDLFTRRRLGLVLRKAELAFLSPAVFDDPLTIRTELAMLSPAKSSWVTHITRGTALICHIRAEIVCLDRNRHCPVFFPPDVMTIFATIATQHRSDKKA